MSKKKHVLLLMVRQVKKWRAFLATLENKKEKEAWDNFLFILENKLPGFVATWIKDLEPALPLFEQSENEIFLIKSSQSFGIQVLQQKHLKEVEEALFEVTGIKRTPRFILDETIKPKKKVRQTIEQKEELANMGCYLYQGYLYSKSIPFIQFIHKLREENK